MKHSPTRLEKQVSDWYIDMGIFHPNKINVEEICKMNNILYQEKPIYSHYIVMYGIKVITVDKRLEESEKREQFFRVLSLEKFHEKDTTINTLNSLNETIISAYTRYALIPHHMLHLIDFNKSRQDIVSQFKNNFHVNSLMSDTRMLDVISK